MKKIKILFVVSLIINIVLLSLLIIILNMNYTFECSNYTGNQKILDYLRGND